LFGLQHNFIWCEKLKKCDNSIKQKNRICQHNVSKRKMDACKKYYEAKMNKYITQITEKK